MEGDCLENECTELENGKKIYQEIEDILKNHALEVQNDVSALKLYEDESQASKLTLEEKIVELQKKITDLEQNLKNACVRERDVLRQNQELESKLARSESSAKRTHTLLEEKHVAQTKKLDAVLEKLSTKLEEKEKRIEELSHLNNQMRKDLDCIEDQRTNRDSKQAELVQEVRVSAEKKIKALQLELSSQENVLSQVQSKLSKQNEAQRVVQAKYQTTLQEEVKMRIQAESRLTDVQQALNQSRSREIELSKAFREFKSETVKIISSFEALKNRIKEEESKRLMAEEYANKCQEEIQKLHQRLEQTETETKQLRHLVRDAKEQIGLMKTVNMIRQSTGTEAHVGFDSIGSRLDDRITKVTKRVKKLTSKKGGL
eukprot:g3672.t1